MGKEVREASREMTFEQSTEEKEGIAIRRSMDSSFSRQRNQKDQGMAHRGWRNQKGRGQIPPCKLCWGIGKF